MARREPSRRFRRLLGAAAGSRGKGDTRSRYRIAFTNDNRY
jgi:hypothetical protein